MADATGLKRVRESKGVKLFKTLTDGVLTKFNMAVLAVAALFLVLGNTEPAKTEEPSTITPGEAVELKQAEVIVDKPRVENGQVHVTATFLNTQDLAFTGYRDMFSLTRDGEPLPMEHFSIAPAVANGAVQIPNPGVPFAVDITVDDVPGTALVLNNLTLRKSTLDMSYNWFDPTPVAELELA